MHHQQKKDDGDDNRNNDNESGKSEIWHSFILGTTFIEGFLAGLRREKMHVVIHCGRG